MGTAKFQTGDKVKFRIKDRDEDGIYVMEGISTIEYIYKNEGKTCYQMENTLAAFANELKKVSKYSRLFPMKATYLKPKKTS